MGILGRIARAWNKLRYRWAMWRMDRNMRRFAEQIGRALLPTVKNYAAEVEAFNAKVKSLGLDIE